MYVTIQQMYLGVNYTKQVVLEKLMGRTLYENIMAKIN